MVLKADGENVCLNDIGHFSEQNPTDKQFKQRKCTCIVFSRHHLKGEQNSFVFCQRDITVVVYICSFWPKVNQGCALYIFIKT